MEQVCRVCGKTFKSIKGLHVHVSRMHNLSVPEYYVQSFQRKDRYTGELLSFKDPVDYFAREFSNLENFIAWSENAPEDEVRESMLNQLKARIEGKKLPYAPSHLELTLNKLPSIDLFKKFFGSYSKACQEINVEPLYDRNIPRNFFDKEEELDDVKILIDTRERKPLEFNKSASLKLDFGDYAVGSPHYNYTYVDRKDESDFRSTMTTGYDRFVRELQRAQEFDAFLFVVVEGSIESIKKNNIINPTKSNLSFIWHNMRQLAHDFPRRCQFIFTGQNGKKLFSKLDNEFYSNYELLYSKAEKLKAEGRREESDKINKKMWFIKKDVFKPAYESYVNQARRVSERLIPKLLVRGKELWRADLQYFLDQR
jgi:hypothetical protein